MTFGPCRGHPEIRLELVRLTVPRLNAAMVGAEFNVLHVIKFSCRSSRLEDDLQQSSALGCVQARLLRRRLLLPLSTAVEATASNWR